MSYWYVWFALGIFPVGAYIWSPRIRKWITIGIIWSIHRMETLLKHIDDKNEDD
jgi:hypothetical protein